MSHPSLMKTLRIFISSPGDVSEERDKAKQVIADLQHQLGDQVTLVPAWEDSELDHGVEFSRD